MSHSSEATPDPIPDPIHEAHHEATPPASTPAGAAAAHDFEVQKRIHQTIRNDPDYDDWEYGTEPLPHEAWVEPKAAPGSDAVGEAGQSSDGAG